MRRLPVLVPAAAAALGVILVVAAASIVLINRIAGARMGGCSADRPGGCSTRTFRGTAKFE